MSGSNPQQQADAFLQQQREHHAKQQAMHQQQMLQKLNELKAQYISEYSMPLTYPAKVETLANDDTEDDGDSDDSNASTTPQAVTKKLRSDVDFINARLIEAGLPLGGGIPNNVTNTANPTMTTTLSKHNEAVSRFVNDLQGTGCYDAVQVYFGNSTQQQQQQAENSNNNNNNNTVDVTVKLKEKNWYKLYIGGGVNSDDLSSLGDVGNNNNNNIISNESLNKLQFETSASLLNITGYADVSTASYSVDPSGASSFKFMHDRPLCSYLPKSSVLYEWLMPSDPRLLIESSSNDERQENNNNNSDNNTNDISNNS